MAKVALVSPHGHFCNLSSQKLDNKDTGGQVVYIYNLALAFSRREEVSRVDIITHRFSENKTINKNHSCPVEHIDNKVRIVRVGKTRTFKIKEEIFTILPEIADSILEFYKLRKEKIPDVWYGHFADGGLVSQLLSSVTNKPFLWTPHSLSVLKTDKLCKIRFQAELESIMKSDLIITSTNNSKQTLIEKYNCPTYKIQVAAPGINNFYLENTKINEDNHPIWKLLELYSENKVLLVAGRACPDKFYESVISMFIHYGEFCKEFRCIIMIIDYHSEYCLSLQNLVLENNLENQIKIIPSCTYPMFLHVLGKIKNTKGILLHPSKRESFGLTVLEAASCGVPVIVNSKCDNTSNLVHDLQCGESIHVEDSLHFVNTIQNLFHSTELYVQYSNAGLKNSKNYSWKSICDIVLNHLDPSSKMKISTSHCLISDFDGTLYIPSEKHHFSVQFQEIKKLLSTNDHCEDETIIICTGRTLENVLQTLREHSGIDIPKCFITSVGTEIWYFDHQTKTYLLDEDYRSLITYKWDREYLQHFIHDHFHALRLQDKANQKPSKLCYYIDDLEYWNNHQKDDIVFRLALQNLQTNMIQSGHFLDFIPARASKGNAIRYLSNKFNLELSKMIVSGDSMNDFEMLNSICPSIVVSNASDSLVDALKDVYNVYFAKNIGISGVVEGIRYWLALHNEKSKKSTLCPYCNTGEKHDCAFLCKLNFESNSYEKNLLPLFKTITIPQFLIDDIAGNSYAMNIIKLPEFRDLFFTLDDFYVYPDPKMGDISKIDKSELSTNGFWFVGWWVHPDLGPTWWNSEEPTQSLLTKPENTIIPPDSCWNPSASSQFLSHVKKPSHSYLHCFLDILYSEEAKNNVLRFVNETRKYLKKLFAYDKMIHALVHFPISPLFSTLHVHFVSGSYFENFEKFTMEIGRVIPIDDFLLYGIEDLSCFICEFHPSRLLLQNFSYEEIYKKYFLENNKFLCIICGKSYSSNSDLETHCATLNHII